MGTEKNEVKFLFSIEDFHKYVCYYCFDACLFEFTSINVW